MSSILSAIFGGSDPEPATPALVSGSPESTFDEKQAEEFQKDLAEAEKVKEDAERQERNKIITRQAAGPQTLFARPGTIPRALKLGGGRRVN